MLLTPMTVYDYANILMNKPPTNKAEEAYMRLVASGLPRRIQEQRYDAMPIEQKQAIECGFGSFIFRAADVQFENIREYFIEENEDLIYRKMRDLKARLERRMKKIVAQ